MMFFYMYNINCCFLDVPDKLGVAHSLEIAGGMVYIMCVLRGCP